LWCSFKLWLNFLPFFSHFDYAGEIDSPIPFGAVNFPFVIQNDWKTANFARAILSAFYNISQRKLWNITNFVMLFQTVMKFLSRFACWDQNLIYNANDHYEIHAAAYARTYLFLFIECLEDITEKLCTHWIKLSRIMSKFTEWTHKIAAQVNL
jgi:hypothetical protein